MTRFINLAQLRVGQVFIFFFCLASEPGRCRLGVLCFVDCCLGPNNALYLADSEKRV